MQSLGDFGLSKNQCDFIKAELPKPFYYLEYGQDDLQ